MKVLFLIPCFCLALSLTGVVYAKILDYESIFNFGDSLSDTGNSLVCDPVMSPIIVKLPYGQTFFQKPTGRFSDGRLVVDFIAEASGLPYLPPYLGLDKGLDYRHGVNFAVGGATALNMKWTNYSLSVQLGWFKKIKPSFCRTKQECDSFFKKSLFLVGEIGANDFEYPFLFGGAKIEQLRPMIPAVIEEISKAVSILIEDGAVELVVPGNSPIGCGPEYLTRFQSSDKLDYDPANGCLIAFNAFAKYYNSQLEEALQLLRQKYPHARIIYADYYGAFMSLVDSAKQSAGTVQEVKAACCGGGGPYNVNVSVMCGQVGHTVCQNPLTYAHWDGSHWTEAANRHIASALINGSFTYPPFNVSLVSSIDLGTYSW